MPLNNDNDKPKAGENNGINLKFYYINENGETCPIEKADKIEITLSEKQQADLAKVLEPLGDLEIVPREE